MMMQRLGMVSLGTLGMVKLRQRLGMLMPRRRLGMVILRQRLEMQMPVGRLVMVILRQKQEMRMPLDLVYREYYTPWFLL